MSLDRESVRELGLQHYKQKIKRGALLQNERLKLYKRPSTWILIGVIVGVILLFLFLSKSVIAVSVGSQNQATWQDNYTAQLESYSSQLKSDPGQSNLQSAVECLTYLLDNQISPTDWRTDAAVEYYNLKYGITNSNATIIGNGKEGSGVIIPDQGAPSGTENPPASSAEAQKRMGELKSILNQNDWRTFIRQKIDDLESGAALSANEDEKQVDIEIYNLYLDKSIVPVSTNNPFGHSNIADENSDAWMNTEIQTIRSAKLCLLRGENEQGALLTYTQRTNYQKAIDVSLKRLSTGTKPVGSDSFLGLLESAGSSLGLLSVLLIVFAGGSIASEFGTGTVKLLLITPHRRKRVFWAKAALLLEVSLITLAAVFVLSFLLSGAYYGFKGIGDMQVMSLFGHVVRFPYLIYVLLQYLLNMLPVLTYGALALMMSAVTRKSAISIAVPIVLMFASDIIMSILRMLSSRTVIPGIKFLLFANTSLQAYLPQASSSFSTASISPTVDSTMTLGFSAAVLFVYLVCFLWIARDSFCRRDVK